MSEWWTYSLSDFLMFAPRTYYRLFALYNTDIWPLQIVAWLAGLAVLWSIWHGGRHNARVVCAILAAAWLFVGWAYHWQRFATINWGAEYYAAGFVLEAMLLIAAGTLDRLRFRRPVGAADRVALALTAVGLLYPLIAVFAGRPWRESEVFGVAPDPTAIATLGTMLLASGRGRWLLMVLPILWCAISAATLWTMGSAEALIPAAAVVTAVGATWMSRQRQAGALHRA